MTTFGHGVVLTLRELLTDALSGVAEPFGGELHPPVVLLDLFFDKCDGAVRQHARRSFLMSADTEVVRIPFPGLASGVGNTKP